MEKEIAKKRVLLMRQEEQKRLQGEELGHLPYLSLGRLYASKGMLNHAVKELQNALDISPGEPTCAAALDQIRKLLN